MSEGNALWLRFFAVDVLYERAVVNGAFKAIFSTLPETEAILGLVPPGAAGFTPIRNVFGPLQVKFEQN